MSEPSHPFAEQVASTAARRRFGWGKLALGCLGTLVALWLLGGVSIWLYFHWQHRQVLADVQAELDRIHAAGEPITPEDMQRYHQGGPGSAEKASRWLEALSALPEMEDDSEEDKALFAALQAASPLSGDELTEAEGMLQKRSEAMKRAADAAKIEGESRFPIEFEDGILAATDHMIGLINLTRVFMLRHRVAVSRGDAEEAIESLNMILAVANAFEFEPVGTSQVTRSGIVRTIFREIPFLLDNLELTDEQLADLQSRLVQVEFQDSFRRGLLGERAAGYHAFHYVIEEDGKKKAEPGILRRPADFRYYLIEMRQLLSAAELSLREAIQQARQVDAAVKKIQTQQSSSGGKRHQLAGSAELLPSVVISIDIWAYAACDRDSAVAAIAFRRYQLAHGKPPESLAALCPEFLAAVREDPFADNPAPIRLVVADDRFAVYSVGANGSDDRALLTDPNSNSDSGIVVRLALPRRKPAGTTTP